VIEQSESIAALAAALSKTQAVVEGAVKGKVNPAFRSKYADLASVWDACREALTENGLSVIQSPGPVADGRMEMTTMLLHASGEWVRGSLTIPLGKVDAQAYGSATTYARRYALAAFVGVAPDDDDGNAATKAKPLQVSGVVTGRELQEAQTSGRKSAAQAKRDGDDVKIKTEIAGLDAAGIFDWRQNFDSYTAHVPASWTDSISDMLVLREEELRGSAAVADEDSSMDDAFRAAVGPSGPPSLAGRNAPHSPAR
jgi:hypothetical protein